MTSPPLWQHQARALDYLDSRDRCLLVIPMGGGKTRTVAEHLNLRPARRTLVLCPSAVISTWRRELERWTDYYQPWPLVGSVADRVRHLESLEPHAILSDLPVAVTNYDVVWRPEMRKALARFAPDLLVLDESHRTKTPNGRISKAVHALSKSVDRAVLLSGRPMPHGPLDLFSQARIVAPEVFGTRFPAFRERYAVMGGPQRAWVSHLRLQRTVKGKPNPDYSPELVAEFGQAMGSFSLIVSDAEVLASLKAAGIDHPGRLPASFRTHSLPSAVRRVYDTLRTDLVVALEEGVVAPSNALVHLLRLAQLASGELNADDRIMKVGHDERAKALHDTLEDVRGPAVVFCRFRHELEAVEEVAKARDLHYAELSGLRRDAMDRDGRMAPDVDVAGVQLQSGKEGVDLSRASTAIFYGHTYSLGDYDQCIARLDRPGQTRPVSIIHLLAEGTVDQGVYTALTERREVLDDLHAVLAA